MPSVTPASTTGDKAAGFLRVPGDGLFHQNVLPAFASCPTISMRAFGGVATMANDIRIACGFLDRGINGDLISSVFRRFGGQRPGAAGAAIN